MLVQQGDDDHVIPRELLDRTWDYVRGESGADARRARYPGGHGLTAPALADLAAWLGDLSPVGQVTAPRR